MKFDGNDLINFNFDYLVRPVNYSDANHPYMLNQIYYQPKALVKTSSGYIFLAPYQSHTGSPFGLSFLSVGQNGELNCREVTRGFVRNGFAGTNLNFVRQPHAFGIIGQGAQTVTANVNDFVVCYQPAPVPTPFIGPNHTNVGLKIRLYPNPVGDYLKIVGLSDLQNPIITIYTVTGRTVISKALPRDNKEPQLSVSKLQSGIYFVRISSNGKIVFQEKMIKE